MSSTLRKVFRQARHQRERECKSQPSEGMPPTIVHLPTSSDESNTDAGGNADIDLHSFGEYTGVEEVMESVRNCVVDSIQQRKGILMRLGIEIMKEWYTRKIRGKCTREGSRDDRGRKPYSRTH